MLWALAVFIILLFIPIKIKTVVIYEDKKIHIYVFNYQIRIKEKVAEKKANIENAKRAERFIKRFLPRDIKTTVNNLKKNRYKARVKLKVEVTYGFEDAALTGMSSGIFHGFSPVMYSLAGMIFNVTGYEYIVNPQFNNPMLNFRISSIISINFAKIIYMLFIILL
jgi:hypothetical protein